MAMKEKTARNKKIVDAWRSGKYSLRDLARKFRLSDTRISQIVNRQLMRESASNDDL